MCDKYFEKKGNHKTHAKNKSLFLIPVKDITIQDIFFKIQKFIRVTSERNNLPLNK